MPFIIDYRSPKSSIEKLNDIDKVYLFNAKNTVYPAISGHPDIFITKIENELIISPNTPQDIIEILNSSEIKYSFGKSKVGFMYPGTSLYNTYFDKEIAITSKNTDSCILEKIGQRTELKVKQGYISCNTFRIGNTFLCSDKGIEKALIEKNLKCKFVDPQGIKLEGTRNGFIGGTLGKIDNKIIYMGSENTAQGKIITKICEEENYEFVSLLNSLVIDVGGILHI